MTSDEPKTAAQECIEAAERYEQEHFGAQWGDDDDSIGHDCGAGCRSGRSQCIDLLATLRLIFWALTGSLRHRLKGRTR